MRCYMSDAQETANVTQPDSVKRAKERAMKQMEQELEAMEGEGNTADQQKESPKSTRKPMEEIAEEKAKSLLKTAGGLSDVDMMEAAAEAAAEAESIAIEMVAKTQEAINMVEEEIAMQNQPEGTEVQAAPEEATEMVMPEEAAMQMESDPVDSMIEAMEEGVEETPEAMAEPELEPVSEEVSESEIGDMDAMIAMETPAEPTMEDADPMMAMEPEISAPEMAEMAMEEGDESAIQQDMTPMDVDIPDARITAEACEEGQDPICEAEPDAELAPMEVSMPDDPIAPSASEEGVQEKLGDLGGLVDTLDSQMISMKQTIQSIGDHMEQIGTQMQDLGNCIADIGHQIHDKKSG